MINRKGSIKIRDTLIAVVVVGLISFALFSYIGGVRNAYVPDSNETFDEDALQDVGEINESVTALHEQLENADNIFSRTFVLIFNGFKIAVLAALSVITSVWIIVPAIFTYLGLQDYIAYILLLIAITIIFTIWGALQGRSNV